MSERLITALTITVLVLTTFFLNMAISSQGDRIDLQSQEIDSLRLRIVELERER